MYVKLSKNLNDEIVNRTKSADSNNILFHKS